MRASVRLGMGAAVATVTAVVLTGCSSSSTGDRAPTTSPTVPASLPAPSTLAHATGARSSLSGFSCQADASGQWSVHGTLANATTSRSRFALAFDVISSKDGTVFARAVRSYVLAGGARTSVTVQDFYRSNPSGLTCVPNVRRADVN